MKVVVINCFDIFEQRAAVVAENFVRLGHEVTVIESDFSHTYKKTAEIKNDHILIKTRPYHRNLSVARLLSHHFFARDTFKQVELMQPEMVYVLIPPNSLAKAAHAYKKKHSEVKLILDILDLWPETLPVGSIKQVFPFTLWRNIRDLHVENADMVITECNLYQEILADVLRDRTTKTLYLAKSAEPIFSTPTLDNTSIHLAYLGSINNIIDIPMIVKLTKAIDSLKPVTIHIIGSGENKDTLLSELKKNSIQTEYVGIEYDETKKQAIFDRCHFGLNIMKESVVVGLTIKSIDYFYAGLPILNTIKSDTKLLVSENQIGFNVTEDSLATIATAIAMMSDEEMSAMRKRTQTVFETHFSARAFAAEFDEIIASVCGK